MGQKQLTFSIVLLMTAIFSSACDETPSQTANATLRVVSTPGGTVAADTDADGYFDLNCGTQGQLCSVEVEVASTVQLEAKADDGFVFDAWRACASDKATCQVTVDAAKTVSANFAAKNDDPEEPGPDEPGPDEPADPEGPPLSYNLAIVLSGTGAGTVTDGGSLNCQPTCAASYPAGTQLSLKASANERSSFQSWAGGCESESGTTCTLTLSEDITVEASFKLKTYRLEVATTGSGGGAVVSDSGAISCQPACQANLDAGTVVTLTAAAAAGSSFTAWQGCPNAAGPVCELSLNADIRLSAEFSRLTGAEETIRVPIRKGADDAEEYLKAVTVNAKYNESFPKNGVDIKSGDIDLVHDRLTDADQIVGLRFADLDIPKNAVITNAYIQFRSDQDYSNKTPTTLYFTGEASTKAKPFVHQSVGGISSRPKLKAAAVRWQPGLWGDEGEAGESERSPDLSSLVQELVNYSDWDNRDNAIAFIISGDGYRAATSFEDSDGEAQLVVSYR